MTPRMTVGVIGAGAMGAGIAQVAASAGHPVVLGDVAPEAIARAGAGLRKALEREVEKERLRPDEAEGILSRVTFATVANDDYSGFAGAGLVVEAIVEDLAVKREVFSALDGVVTPDAILATNTSSLSVTAIATACLEPGRVVGAHFFNPATRLPLVEIVPGYDTSTATVGAVKALIDSWGKTTVVAKDTPGFIVNRIARPFYGEALRLLEEGVAEAATIDWAMRELGGFRMGPFELMDLIGLDVNYAVSHTVFEAFHYDPRYRPSLIQRQLVEAKRLGRKTGKGFYEYGDERSAPEPNRDHELGQSILDRVLAMLINEAADALFLGVASREDIDLAMTKGVNYPKGLLHWADEIGVPTVLERLDALQREYGDDRYRPSPLLRRMVRNGRTFYG